MRSKPRASLPTPGCRWQDAPYGDPEAELAEYWKTDKGVWHYSLPDPGMGKRSVASVAGFITASARAKLLAAMQQLVTQGDQVFMCDTDSVVTSGRLPASMVGSDLGQWDLEDSSPASDCEFVAPKQYTFRSRTKCKGIRQPRQGNSEYRQAQFSKWSTDVLSTDPQRQVRLEEEAMVKDVDKKVTGENRKRKEKGYNRFNDPLVL